jgi:PAB-dependent poly(A)-specific ribonuclease subunit 2
VARHDDMKDLRCMTFMPKNNNEILVAGSQDTMLVIDLQKGEVVKQVGDTIGLLRSVSF